MEVVAARPSGVPFIFGTLDRSAHLRMEFIVCLPDNDVLASGIAKHLLVGNDYLRNISQEDSIDLAIRTTSHSNEAFVGVLTFCPNLSLYFSHLEDVGSPRGRVPLQSDVEPGL
jgi:hypothetical protein